MGYRRLATVIAAGVLLIPAAAYAATPIPSVGLARTFIGAPSTAAPLGQFAIPQNPYLAPNPYNNMHNDPYATNTYPGPGPRGRGIQVKTALYGVEECATQAFDQFGQIVALCGDVSGPVLRLINPTTLNIKASYVLPGRDLTSGANPLSDLCGGAYFYLDNSDRAVVATTDRRIMVVADTGTKYVLQHTYDLTSVVPAKDCLIALMPSWTGTIWFATKGGVVGTVNPTTGVAHAVTLTGEGIDNSFAVDAAGGVYVVSDHAMYRFDAAADGTPTITWREVYDRGSVQKPGQLSQGSGTTPALVGSDLVAITDNADPQMHINVYNRNTGAFICQQGVFAPGASDTENSLVAVGDGLIAENNYGYQGPQSTLLGKTTSPGVARVNVIGNTCSLAWTSNVVAPTSVPKVSLQSGLLYVYSKPANSLGQDAWYFTAIDVRTGQTVYSRLTGVGPQFNNHYASIYLGPNGTAYIATLAGMVSLRDTY